MKNRIRTILFALWVGIASSFVSFGSDLAHAENGTTASGKAFLGLKYAYHDIDMSTQFTRRTSGVITEESTFQNDYTSNAGGLFVGYTHPFGKFYLSGQVFFDLYDDEFELEVGSSRITNSINHAFGIDLMPGVYLYKGLSVYGQLGLVGGEFEFVKSSPTSTNYNASDTLYGYTLGIGLAYDITASFTAKAGYARTQYEDIEINATAGTRSDKTVVEPEGAAFYLTLQYNFN